MDYTLCLTCIAFAGTARSTTSLLPWQVNLNLLDLDCAPYVVYGDSYIDLVSLTSALEEGRQAIIALPFLPHGARQSSCTLYHRSTLSSKWRQNLDLRRVLLVDPRAPKGAGGPAKTRLEPACL